jgi:type IV secretion system protein VirB6
MSLYCELPEASAGVAVRLSGYLDCQARSLGENGFQALAGGPLGASLLSGLLTIFVALIGYRLLLGETPGVRHGVSWMARVGLVVALVTGWPAFQTLVYRVAVDGPLELAGVVMPASGLSPADLEARVQRAYDRIRVGANPRSDAQPTGQAAAPAPATQSAAAPTQPGGAPAGAPQTATLLVLATVGATGAFRVATGFLLAIGPLAIMALLFDATLGLFSGWIRALAGMALASLATVIATAAGMALVDSETPGLPDPGFAGVGHPADPQALTTIVAVVALLTLVSGLAALRMTSAFVLRRPAPGRRPDLASPRAGAQRPGAPAVSLASEISALRAASPSARSRGAAVADALAAVVRREQAARGLASGPAGSTDRRSPAGDPPGSAFGGGLGAVGRRNFHRRTHVAARRDNRGS